MKERSAIHGFSKRNWRQSPPLLCLITLLSILVCLVDRRANEPGEIYASAGPFMLTLIVSAVVYWAIMEDVDGAIDFLWIGILGGTGMIVGSKLLQAMV